jgi:hypothetical protein
MLQTGGANLCRKFGALTLQYGGRVQQFTAFDARLSFLPSVFPRIMHAACSTRGLSVLPPSAGVKDLNVGLLSSMQIPVKMDTAHKFDFLSNFGSDISSILALSPTVGINLSDPLASNLPTLEAMNRNARRPKRPNHGKRPCSHVRRRAKRIK